MAVLADARRTPPRSRAASPHRSWSRWARRRSNGLLLAYDAAGKLLTAELFGGKPATKGPFPDIDDVDAGETHVTALAATDKALRIGGSFIGNFEVSGEDGNTLRQVATAQLEGFVVARPVPPPGD